MFTSRKFRFASACATAALAAFLCGTLATSAHAAQRDEIEAMDWDGGFAGGGGSGAFPLGVPHPSSTPTGEVPKDLQGVFKFAQETQGVYFYTPKDPANTIVTQGHVDAFNAAKRGNGPDPCQLTSDEHAIQCSN